jgi:hypothetical protein
VPQPLAAEAGITLEAMLQAMPVSAVVVDERRHIVASNLRIREEFGVSALQALVGRRLGEALGCGKALDSPLGCGTSGACAWCGAFSAVTESIRRKVPVVAECRVSSQNDGLHALDVEVRASPLQLGGASLTVVTLRDISADKRRRVLERIFFHDVLNTAGGICGIATVLSETDDPEAQREFKAMLLSLSDQLIDEINSQRQLMAAETGELQVAAVDVSAADLVRNVCSSWSGSQVAAGRSVELGVVMQTRLITDVTLLRRILGNMVKNALEATSAGGVVTVSADDLGTDVSFSVHNGATMPAEVQQQVFLRSFSTKGEGRGIGTYSIKLLGERFLGGRVSFLSSAEAGTTFSIRLPKLWRGADRPQAG